MISLFVPLSIFLLGTFFFWLATIIDVLKRNFEKDVDKIVWVLIMLFLGLVGSILYVFLKKPRLGQLGKAGKYLMITGLILFVIVFIFMFLYIPIGTIKVVSTGT